MVAHHQLMAVNSRRRPATARRYRRRPSTVIIHLLSEVNHGIYAIGLTSHRHRRRSHHQHQLRNLCRVCCQHKLTPITNATSAVAGGASPTVARQPIAVSRTTRARHRTVFAYIHGIVARGNHNRCAIGSTFHGQRRRTTTTRLHGIGITRRQCKLTPHKRNISSGWGRIANGCRQRRLSRTTRARHRTSLRLSPRHRCSR